MYMEYVALTVGAGEAAAKDADGAGAGAAGGVANELSNETKPIKTLPNRFDYRTETPTILVHGKSIQLP